MLFDEDFRIPPIFPYTEEEPNKYLSKLHCKDKDIYKRELENFLQKHSISADVSNNEEDVSTTTEQQDGANPNISNIKRPSKTVKTKVITNRPELTSSYQSNVVYKFHAQSKAIKRKYQSSQLDIDDHNDV